MAERFVIVTGMSGAGITTALKILEDVGYFCVDNLPIPLMGKFVGLLPELAGDKGTRVALGIDARSGKYLDELEGYLDREKENLSYEILFMDASDETLIKRYKETRREHPLAVGRRVDEGIALERQKIAFLKKRAKYVIDTSRLLTRNLRQELCRIFAGDDSVHQMKVRILSFGYKYGVPQDADLVFDVRFLPNPFYVPELKPLTGLDEPVYTFVTDNPQAQAFLQKVVDLLAFLLPHYQEEGKTSLVVGVGCTGGKHRSVSLARQIYTALSHLPGYSFVLDHRDIGKDQIRKDT